MKIRILLAFLCLPFYVTSQSFLVSGLVIDKETGKPIHSSHLVIENTLIGTTTNLEGLFKLDVPKEYKSKPLVLLVTALGYTKTAYVIDAKHSNIKIELNPADVQISEVLVTTYKNILTAKNSSTVPMLLSNKDITQFGAQNIPEILLKQAGISLAGQSYHAAPSIRGLARKRVMVLLDGERISSERNVGTPGTFINPSEIERIEILKGPYSTLYGSNAIGGVINIISKSYEQPFYTNKIGGRLDANYKTVNNGKNIALALNGKLSKLKYHIHAGYRKSDNYKTPNDENLMNTFSEEKHIGSKFIYDINTNNQLRIKTLFSKGGPIGKPAYDTLTNAVHDYDNHYSIGLNDSVRDINKIISKIEVNTSRHEHNLGVKIIKHKQEENPEDDKLINNRKELKGIDYYTQLEIYLTLNEKLNIITGFDGYFRNKINISEEKVVKNFNTGIFLMDKETDLIINGYQNSYGVFAQSNFIVLENLVLNGGLRWSYVESTNPTIHNSQTRTAWSGNTGLSYNPLKYLSIKANFGSAFRAPDIKELYVTTKTPGGLNISNLDLVPERSYNLDIAFVYRNDKNIFQLSAFRNEVHNMIILDWDTSLANRTGVFKNIGKGLLYGIEFLANLKINQKFNVYTNISKIYGKDVNTDDELMDVPPLQVNSGIKFTPNKKIGLSLSVRYSAEQKEVAEDDIPTEDFTILDFSGTWCLMKNIKLNVSVTNILNEKYREHFHFGWMHAQARSFNIGFNFNF